MINVKNLSYAQLYNRLIGNKVHFKSDCAFFPNFDVVGRVIRMTNLGHEIIIEVITNNRKQLKIGSNMKNLRYEIL